MLASLGGYCLVFAVLLFPWWTAATVAVSPGNDPRDARLIVWILGWVAQGLRGDPWRIFDAPIYHPAPGQLAGSEHFLTAQLVFAPAYWATDNPVFAANLVAILSYPAAALAMERLLVAQGLGRGAAWLGGLGYALGALRVPASLHVVQFLAFFLPLVALRLQRLRERPAPGPWLTLVGCLVAAMFSSYYLALLAVITVAIWGLFEVGRSAPPRRRMAASTLGALIVAGAVLWAASGPYLHRPLGIGPGGEGAVPGLHAFDALWRAAARAILVNDLRDPVWVAFAILAAGGTIVGLAGGPRGLTLTALAFVSAGGALLVWGWPAPFDDVLAFFRTRSRYLLLASFGASVLMALGADALRRRLAGWRGAALLALLAGVLVASRAAVVVPRPDPVLAVARDGGWYEELAQRVQAEGPGPLLELPYVSGALVDASAEAMVGQLRHGLPLVTGFTGYPPPHHALLQSLIGALPSRQALDDLVDLTHLRWIVVRPADQWPNAVARERMLAGLRRAAPGLERTVGPWVVWRIDRAPGHESWFDYVASGPRPDHSVLGASLAPIAEANAVAVVSAVLPPGPVRAGRTVWLTVTADNRGGVTWPAWTARGTADAGLVRWELRWRRVGAEADGWGAPSVVGLRRDVPEGESITQRLPLVVPRAPGAYDVEIAVRQRDGAAFAGPGNQPAVLRVDVAS